eukprot:scaffold80351_cov22-Tisochrysis_lutea.AAC.1
MHWTAPAVLLCDRAHGSLTRALTLQAPSSRFNPFCWQYKLAAFASLSLNCCYAKPCCSAGSLHGTAASSTARVVHTLQRQLYRYVNELMVPSHELKHYKPPSPAELCSYYHSDGEVSLDPSK